MGMGSHGDGFSGAAFGSIVLVHPELTTSPNHINP